MKRCRFGVQNGVFETINSYCEDEIGLGVCCSRELENTGAGPGTLHTQSALCSVQASHPLHTQAAAVQWAASAERKHPGSRNGDRRHRVAFVTRGIEQVQNAQIPPWGV